MHTNVIVTLQVAGKHCWPGAPKEVEYLQDMHRHLFHIEAKKVVQHADREIEIITLKESMQRYLRHRQMPGHEMHNFGSMSCEMIARNLLEYFGLRYCKVMEDGENGAEVIA